MRFRILVIFITLFLFLNLSGFQLEIVDRWNNNKLMSGQFRNAVFDSDGNIIIMFAKSGISLVNKKSAINISQKGQGPGDILNWVTICNYGENLAEVELFRKIQIFSLENNRFKWRKNIWREEKNCIQFPNTALYLDKKFIFGGTIINNNTDAVKGKEAILAPYFVRVLNEKGEFEKQLVNIKFKEFIRSYLFDCFLIYNKRNVFFVVENDLSIYFILRKTYEVEKKIDLKKPEFYKKMPDDFYLFKEKMGRNLHPDLKFEKWKTGYSAITNVLKTNKYFVIQIRTADEKLKKFALLFYSADSFKLTSTYFTNDLLIAAKNSLLYFLSNGDPAFDDDAGELSVNIYKIVESRK